MRRITSSIATPSRPWVALVPSDRDLEALGEQAEWFLEQEVGR